jgi:ABC-2 type transport system permease protein
LSRSKNRGFSALFFDELKGIFSSPYKMLMLFVAPLFTFVLIIAIFYKGVVRELPVGVVDMDRSALSSELKFSINSSPSIEIYESFNSMNEASKALQDNQIYSIIYIPGNFEKNIITQQDTKVSAFINSQFILIGKSIAGELQNIFVRLGIEVDVLKNLIKDKNIDIAMSESLPVQIQQNYFFNEYKNYTLFLVSALLPSIWQIFVMISAIIAFGVTFKEKRVAKWLVLSNRNLFVAIWAKLLPYTLIMFFVGSLCLVYLYMYEPWPMQGSWAFLLFSLFITTLAYQMIALMFFAVLFDYAAGLSVCAFYAAPAFAYIGITYPEQNMSIFASIWHKLLPISYYMQIQIEQSNYGSPLHVSISHLYAIALFFVFSFLITYLRFYTTLRFKR